MIKLKNIIKEYNNTSQIRTSEISLETAVELIEKSGIRYDENTIFPYRGTENVVEYGFVQPSLHNRTSRFTSNIYTLLMDNLPCWKSYPKRSKSIMCSTNKSNANNYHGELNDEAYVVIPLNKNAKFGVCSSHDLWFSFKNGIGFSMEDFNLLISNLDEKFTNRKIYTYTEYKELLILFKHMDKLKNSDNGNDLIYDHIMSTMHDSNEQKYFLKWLRNPDITLHDYIAESICPKKNGFKLIKFYKDNTSLISDNEVWTDSDCVLVLSSNVNQINKKLKNKIGMY
jgi:hypothetical protein